MGQETTDRDYIEAASRFIEDTLGDNGAVDDDAKVSRAETGAWVQAWVWVEKPEPAE